MQRAVAERPSRAEPMGEDELVSQLEAERVDAVGYHSSELAKQQADAMSRFLGRPYGDEEAGRSTVVTRDIADTVNWLLPDLMRMFIGSDELVTIEPGSQEDEQPYEGDPSGRPITECVADYLDHIFFRDNPGEAILHDFAWDGLVQKIGVVSVAWQEPSPLPPRRINGVSGEQVVKYHEDPEYELLEGSDRGDGTYDIVVRRTPAMGRVRIEAVPQEEALISRRAKSIETADYHGRMREVFLADVIREFPEAKHDLVDPSGTGDDDEDGDPRRTIRFINEGGDERRANGADRTGRRKVTLLEEYIRVDYDGDGVTELRHVKRVGKTILFNEAVERSEFVVWSPVRMAHKAIGQSVAEMLETIQLIRTLLTRRMLDGLSQSLTPRTAVNINSLGEDGVNDLIDNRIGGVIRVTGDPRTGLMPIVTPDVSGSALQALEHFDQKSEQASGVTRHAQGIDPTALNKTATGIDLLQAASKSRVELIARWLGVAVEEVFNRILHLICAHQDRPRQVRLKGKWMALDPRRFSDEMAVRIHVGMSASSRERQIANLSAISQKQEAILMQAGMSNPLVTISHYRNTLARLVEAMGYKDPTRFFAEIPQEAMQPQEPQPDPKLIEAQVKLQIEQAKAQSKAELDTQKAQHQAQIAELKLQHASQMQEAKIAGEQAIAEMRVRAETQMAAQRTQAEMMLARWETEQEMKLERERMRLEASAAGDDDDGIHGGVRFGGRIG